MATVNIQFNRSLRIAAVAATALTSGLLGLSEASARDFNFLSYERNYVNLPSTAIHSNAVTTADLKKNILAVSAPIKYLSYGNLWPKLRSGFALPQFESDDIEKFERQFSKSPYQLGKVFQRARNYLPYIYSEVSARGLPSEIALLPFVESLFDPYAFSPSKAAGLWQFVPVTAKEYDLTTNWWYEGRLDVIDSTEAALRYLEHLYEKFDGNWMHVLAAYNAGENRVARLIEKNIENGKSTDVQALNLSTETLQYIPKLFAIRNIVANPGKFGISLKPMPDQSQFEVVEFDSQTDLRIIASIAGVSDREIYRLNPGLRRLATQPNGPHRVLVPVTEAQTIRQAMKTNDFSQRINQLAYRVQPGDYLGKIAQEFEIPQSAIVVANSIKSADYIRAGEVLMIPLVKKEVDVYPLLLAGPAEFSQRYEHRVKSGDTLWGIANRYDVRLAQLSQWNQIDPTDHIRPNQVIIVYIK